MTVELFWKFKTSQGFVITVDAAYVGFEWSHLSVRCGHWFRQVLSLCIELKQWREVLAPHSVIHVVHFSVFFREDIAALCILRYNVLLPRCPEMHKQKQNVLIQGWATGKETKCFLRAIWSSISELHTRTYMSLFGRGLIASLGRLTSMMSLNLAFPMLTANCEPKHN